MSFETRVRIQFECPALSEVTVIACRGREAINSLTDFRIEVRCIPVDDMRAVLAQPGKLILQQGEQAPVERTFSLWVSEIELIEENVRAPDSETALHSQYSLRLRPAFAALEQGGGYRMFAKNPSETNGSIDIVKKILDEYGFTSLLSMDLGDGYAERPQCVQYDESDWDFVCRLLADEGIPFWFQELDSKYCLILADDWEKLGTMRGESLLFRDRAANAAFPHVFELVLHDELCTENAHMAEFDVRQPSVLIEGRAGEEGSRGYYYEYPARVLDETHATARAQVRRHQLARSQRLAEARSTSILPQPGLCTKILQAADDVEPDEAEAFNGRYLVTAVDHRWTVDNAHGAAGYENGLELAQFEHFPRPAIPEWPALATIESAKTTGPDDIHVNDLGDVRLSFPWDRSGIIDEHSSWWSRTVQMNLGGSMMLPRVGWEVPVMFNDGNPDRPVVMGRLYNPGTPLPYTLPGQKDVTAFKGESVPGGGAHNEVRISDTAGDEKVLINAVKDFSHFVGGDRTSKIGMAMSHSTGESRIVKVSADQTTTIGVKQDLDVGDELTTEVSGTRTILVGGLELYDVTGNRKLNTTPYGEVVGALYGLQCNQHNAEVLGAYAQAVGGNASYAAGVGMGESVAGGRIHEIGGSFTIKCSDYGENILGWKTLKTGSCTVESAAGINTEGSGSGTVEISGLLKVTAASNVVFTAEGDLTIEVSKLTTPHGAIGGGKLTSTKGTLKGKGKIEWKGGADIE